METPPSSDEPGLLLIQIDGLARRHVEEAIASGRMPLLKSLLRRERYRLHTMYAGVPSTTPAVQGELFYGVRQAVPAFAFRDSETGQRVRMYDASAAVRKQRKLETDGEAPLLEGGSAYCNIYAGGAAEPHYCAAAMGWGQITKGVRPWTWLLIGLLYTPEILRACLLGVLELGIALSDALRGIFERPRLRVELGFVVRRFLISVVFRELATIAASLDVTRGLPVVEVNFLGYDEQAHHRGPDARYAHWTLGGIDNAIERICRAATTTTDRDYALWIYSDHGQERVTPYQDRHGRSVQEAIEDVLARFLGSSASPREQERPSSSRASFLRRSTRAKEPHSARPSSGEMEVIAMGPVGLLYCERDLPRGRWEEVAAALVEEAHIPLVLMSDGDGRAQAWARGRRGVLPDDGVALLGEDHPFLAQAAEDMARLANHPDAGRLLIAGWAAGEEPTTFVVERGAHGGCGPNELAAFALLPGDAIPDDGDVELDRPLTLRKAALDYRRGAAVPRPPRRKPSDRTATRAFRVMTYNIHSCMGMDGRTSPERVARVIAQERPDVVALQEVDVGRRRTGCLDQARQIAKLLDMHCEFFCAFHVAEEMYGHAVLSRFPIRVIRGGPLPTLLPKQLEPRGALWVEIEVEGQPVQLLNTHLGLVSGERQRQIETLLGPEWLGHPACRDPVVLCGDLNAGPRSGVYRALRRHLVDAQVACESTPTQNTFFSSFPFRRIDHIFVRGDLTVANACVVRTQLARVASDHLPLVAELQLPATP